MPARGLDDSIEAVRRFNRFYTRKIGVLDEGLLDSAYSLTQARVLHDLAARAPLTATALGRELGLDPGYLSRILRGFAKAGLISTAPAPDDGRAVLVSLTRKGRAEFAKLNARAQAQGRAMLRQLSGEQCRDVTAAMAAIERALGDQPRAAEPYVLRPHRPGDLGWIVHRHAALYAEEYGWDGTFEAMVAEVAAKFIRGHDPARERCWIAERGGRIVGSVVLAAQSKHVAKLRLLLVEPEARGLGIGARLVDECIRFARQAGYRKMTLWTNSILHAARHLYERAGFRLVESAPHLSFGHDLVGETWELRL
jgi:DNA-binding MarR family transcriptional regulator/RimJ/RimL family protein N-acetyltransferase